MSWLVVFAVCAAMDFAWAVYIRHTADSHAFLSASWAVMVFLLGAIGIIAYTENHWLLIPACAGCFAGTYLAVRPRSARHLGGRP